MASWRIRADKIASERAIKSKDSNPRTSSPPSMETLLLSPAARTPPQRFFLSRRPRTNCHAPSLRVQCKAKDTGETESSGATIELAAAVGGLVSNPVVGYSLYVLKTTGCGLPPGPGGSLGALEGVSFLVLAGIVGWSLYTKAKTGSGLPAGPYGLLGAAEGLSYLTAVAVVVVFGLQFLERGYLPGPVPGEQCFG